MPLRTVREATFDVLRQTGLMRVLGEALPSLAGRLDQAGTYRFSSDKGTVRGSLRVS